MQFFLTSIIILAILVPTVLASGQQETGAHYPTPLESSKARTLPTSAQIDNYLRALASSAPNATLIPLGYSAGGRPMQALCISADTAFCQLGQSQPGKLSVLLIGSQHGTEPSGAEALQRTARELIQGSLRSYQSTMDFVLIVNGNPDGRDLHRRVNANKINLSTDYVALSQPESQAVVTVLHRFQPDAILDLHESALLKKRTLGAQGFLTDFETQFETANNPNVENGLRQWSREIFLPGLLAAVNARGQKASHYIGEITDINQAVTHGGLTPRTLRNYAGLRGSLSVLVENRLDPAGKYPTPRNIATRVDKQFVSIAAFLSLCQAHRPTILQRVQSARYPMNHSTPLSLFLVARYAPTPKRPTIWLPMRRRDTGVLEQHAFEYHSQIVGSHKFVAPRTYFILAHSSEIAALLDRHGVTHTRLEHPTRFQAVRQYIKVVHPPTRSSASGKRQPPRVELRESIEEIAPGSPYLRIDLDGITARIVPLLLDPRSASSIFHTPQYSALLTADTAFFVARSADP